MAVIKLLKLYYFLWSNHALLEHKTQLLARKQELINENLWPNFEVIKILHEIIDILLNIFDSFTNFFLLWYSFRKSRKHLIWTRQYLFGYTLCSCLWQRQEQTFFM